MLSRRFFFDGAQAELGALPVETVSTGGGFVETAYMGAGLVDADDVGQGLFVGDVRCVFAAIGEVVVWGTNPFLDFTSLIDDDGEAMIDDDAEALTSE